MTTRIREIRASDRNAYRTLRSRLDTESEMWGAQPGERERLGDVAGAQFDRILGDRRSAIFVAERLGELVGFLSLETAPWQSLNRTAALMIGVRDSQQGEGIATRLFTTAEAWAAGAGLHRIELLVMRHNTVAIGLYAKMGYREEGIRRESSYLAGEYINEVYMAKLVGEAGP